MKVVPTTSASYYACHYSEYRITLKIGTKSDLRRNDYFSRVISLEIRKVACVQKK
jgi:hypothetical protein